MRRPTPHEALAIFAVVLLTSFARASGVDPTKLSLPKGPGSIEGLASTELSPSLSTGAASYEIPIVVPPASANFGPNLSLVYDSSAGLTELGIGWRVSGTPKVRRRTQNGLPRFDDSDAFELVGIGVPCDLVEVETNVFRPSVEDGSFVRLQRSEDGRSWEARTKAGPTLLFGGDGSVEAEGAHVAAYLLREQHDRHGHVVSYEWDTSDGHALLTRVTWNAFDVASKNEVAFAYETRPDRHRGFANGIDETLSRRLHTVTVTHGRALVRRYELTYGSEAHPALRSVELVGSDGVTRMPDSRFEYTSARLAASAEQLVTMRAPPGQSPSDPNVTLADLDGDGLPDLLVGAASRFRSYLNRDGKRWASATDWGAASPSVSLAATGVQLADVDADGAVDLVVKSGKDTFRYFPAASGAGFGASVAIANVPGFSFEDPDVRVADMDGDRRADVVVTTEAGIAVGYNLNGIDWTEPVVVGAVDSIDPPRFSDGQTSLCDVNGDRVEDLCSLHPGGMTYWLGRGRGLFAPAAAATGVPAFDPASPYQLVDLNGDGWVDLVRVSTTELDVALATSEGAFGSVDTIAGTPERGPKTDVEFADMNGSGTTDVAWIDVTAAGTAAWRYLELFPDGRAGLLSRIDDGLGKVQTIAYGPASVQASASRDAGQTWSGRMNVAMPVVLRTSVDLSLGDPVMTTEWTYRDGIYDPRERTFAGFTSGTRTELGDDTTSTLLVEQTFDAGLVHRGLRGALLTEESRDEAGNVFSRTSRTYTSRLLQIGLGGTSIEYCHRSTEQVELLEGDASAARTLLTETDEDDYGNVTEQRSWGEVRGDDALVGNDEAKTIRTYANDAKEWLLGFVVTEELTDGNGKRVSFGRHYYDGDAMQGLPLGQVSRGDVAREEAWTGPGENDFELVIATRYDADGLPVETKDGRGGGRFYEWASDHTSLRSERVKLDGDVVLVETAQIDGGSGALLAATDYTGQTTRYDYDAFGRLSAVIKPDDTSDEPTVRYTYDARAPLSRVITESRVSSGAMDVERSEVLFDGGGRKRGTLTQDGERFILAGVSLYDARGSARRTLLPRAVGAAERTEPPLQDGTPLGSDTFRDALGRELRTRSPSGIESRTVYAPLETRHFDGGQSDATSPYEHTPTIERKDGLGRIVEHVRTLGGAELSARYTYDAAGNLRSRTDPEGNVSRYGYDGRGRRITVSDPDAGEHRFTYDATGDVIERRYPDGVVARFGFDLAGRATTEDRDGDGTPEIIRTWDQAPDGSDDAPYLGRLSRVTEPSGYVEHTYDVRGRVVATRYEIDGVAYVTRSDYDAQDREIRHYYPDGSSVDIHRNPRGQISAYGSAVRFTYADDGLETARTLSTGATVATTYDDERRRVDLDATGTRGSTIEHLRWTYDAGGNLTGVRDLRAGITADRDRTETYAYDNLYRLAGARGAWGETAYAYSASGNLLRRTSSVAAQNLSDVAYGARPHLPSALDGRVTTADARGRLLTDGERDYTWNDADQLVEVSRRDGGSVKSVFGADGARRMRTERRADGATTTTHFIDSWSESENGKLTRYVFHAGQRILRLGADSDADGITTKPALASVGARWSNGRLASLILALFVVLAFCRRTTSSARLPRLFVATVVTLGFLAACNSVNDAAPKRAPHREVTELSDADSFIVGDLLGSVLAETTAQGTPTASFATYPFGATRYDTSKASWKYASSPRDGAVSLDHMGARFYAPELGLWTSPDPVASTEPTRLVTADFAAANPYVYANQTPLIAVDRDGRFWQIFVGAFVGAVVGGASELVHQYVEHGKIEDPGRIGAAAAGGAIAGAITTVMPIALAGTAGTVAGGITRRLIESHGKSAGTLREVVTDAVTGFASTAASRATGSILKTVGSRALDAVSADGAVQTASRLAHLVGDGEAIAGEGSASALRAGSSLQGSLLHQQLTAVEIAGARMPGELTGYSGHALNQAISRDGVGVSVAAIRDAFQNPVQIAGEAGGKFRFVGSDATAIVNAEGNMITTWAESSAGQRLAH